MNPRKKKRTEELLRREISNICLYELRDPRVGFFTVTQVELAEDQRSAKVSIVVRGAEDEVSRTLSTLRNARGYIQALVAKRLPLRYTPVLSFREDKDVLTARRVDKLIDEARREDREFRETP
jgi:ribosome-binding factor A